VQENNGNAGGDTRYVRT